jgi:HAD superfamily hydrolase (TIGR01509 family)
MGTDDAASHSAWLLDFDGTLYDARFVRLAMAAELAVGGWNAVRVLRAFRKEHEHIRRELSQTKASVERADGAESAAPAEGRDAEHPSPFEDQIDRTAAALRIQREIVHRLVHEWMIHRPGRYIRLFRRRDLEQEIVRFRAAGGKTALVSDYPVSKKLKAIGLGTLFDVVIANGEPDGPKRLKPAPEGYLLAAERLGVSPRECLVVGDRQDADGAAAKAAGMSFRLIR